MAQQAISARRCSHSAPKAWVVVSVLPQTVDECATLPSCERALFEDGAETGAVNTRGAGKIPFGNAKKRRAA